jgi:putative transcriptional regulator
MRRLTATLAVLLLGCLTALPQQLAVGRLLIATNKMQDADLARSVVLLIQYDKLSAMGLIVNRPSTVSLWDEFPEVSTSQASASARKVWAGGPIPLGFRGLLQSPFRPGDSQEILNNVALVSDKTLLSKLLSATTPPDNLRIYAGYVGWTALQLRNEVAKGLWLIRTADPATIFAADPDSMWTRLTAPRPVKSAVTN